MTTNGNGNAWRDAALAALGALLLLMLGWREIWIQRSFSALEERVRQLEIKR